MNIEEYISSGILEAYVLGDLTSAERAEVEKNLSLYPELVVELRAIEEMQETLLMKSGVSPKASIRERIFDQIDDTQNNGALSPELDSTGNDQSISLRTWKLAAAAAFAIAVMSSFLAYNYWQKWRSTSQDLIALQAQNERIAQDYNQVNNKLSQFERDLAVLQNPDFTKVLMSGTPNAPEAQASVFWNPETSELFLQVQKMKALASDQQYQLWAIIDGKPVDAGVFDATVEGLMKMKSIGKGATTFAVTIEPRGGKPSPTLETMQVAGNVEKS